MSEEPLQNLFWASDDRVTQGATCYQAKAFTIYHCGKCGVNLNTKDQPLDGYSRIRCRHCDALNDLSVKFDGEITER